MNTRNILIISDSENQKYWGTLADLIQKIIGPVHIILDSDVRQLWNNHPYDMIVVDVSNIEHLYQLIPEIQGHQPLSRIIVVSSSPTWKLTRDVIRLGAASLIRKSSNVDDVINGLQLL